VLEQAVPYWLAVAPANANSHWSWFWSSSSGTGEVLSRTLTSNWEAALSNGLPAFRLTSTTGTLYSSLGIGDSYDASKWYDVYGASWLPTPRVAVSQKRPVLVKGVRYWVAAGATDAGQDSMGWQFNPAGAAGTLAIKNNCCAPTGGLFQTWTLLSLNSIPQPAVRVTGDLFSGALPPRVDAILNAASFTAPPIAPGQIVTFFGAGIGPPELTTLLISPSGRVDTTLAETRVLFDGTAAPLIYARSDQVGAIVPFGVDGKGSVEVELEYRRKKSNSMVFDVAAAAPYKPKSRAAAFFVKMKARLWIDKTDYQWVNREVDITGTLTFGGVLFRIAKGWPLDHGADSHQRRGLAAEEHHRERPDENCADQGTARRTHRRLQQLQEIPGRLAHRPYRPVAVFATF
jgi:hypothetical protein